MDLAPCTGCRRHVSVCEKQCPFCGHGLALIAGALPTTRLSRAGLIAFALAAGCDKSAPVASKDPVPSPSSSTTPSALASASASATPSVVASSPDGAGSFGGPLKPGYGGSSQGMIYGGAPVAPQPSMTDASIKFGSPAGIAGAEKVVTAERVKFNRCADSVFKFDPNIKGSTTFELAVDKAGAVTDVKFAKDTIGSPQFKSCTLSVALRMTFAEGPKPAGAKVTFEVTVTPKPGK